MHKQTKKENVMIVQLKTIKEFTWDLAVPYPPIPDDPIRFDYDLIGEYEWQIKDAIEDALKGYGWGICNGEIDMTDFEKVTTAIVDRVDEIIKDDDINFISEYDWLCDLKTAVSNWDINYAVDFYNEESEVVS